MAAEQPAIVISDDDSDSVPRQTTRSMRKAKATTPAQRMVATPRQTARAGSTTRSGSRSRRRGMEVSLQQSTPQIHLNARQKGSQTAPETPVIDLTTLPDDDVYFVSSSGAPPPARWKRRLSDSSKCLPSPQESPPPASSAKCSICFEKMDGSMACGPCGHVFCETCLRAAIKAQKKCPTCRKTMQPKQIHKVYLNL